MLSPCCQLCHGKKAVPAHTTLDKFITKKYSTLILKVLKSSVLNKYSFYCFYIYLYIYNYSKWVLNFFRGHVIIIIFTIDY